MRSRRVQSTGVSETLAHRRVPLPENLRMRMEPAKSLGLSRLARPASASDSRSTDQEAAWKSSDRSAPVTS